MTVADSLLSRPKDLFERIPLWIITSLFLVAGLIMRFWRLEEFNVMVFDEVHFARFASSYLTQTPFYENHPPLAKYIIAAGIWLSEQFHLGGTEQNNLSGYMMAPFSYRWMNALFGSFLAPLFAVLAYQLNGKKSYAFLAGFLLLLEGMTLVESRYALINIYIILFGFLGISVFFRAVRETRVTRFGLLFLSAVALAASFSVKVSGLAFPLTLFLLWIATKLAKIGETPTDGSCFLTTMQGVKKVRFIELIFMGFVGLVFYVFIWGPHIALNTNMTFWEWQTYMVGSHMSVGGNEIHPYCSSWYTWPFIIRPVAYLFQSQNIDMTTFFYDVHALGNPALWWQSSLAIFGLLLFLFQRVALATSSLVPQENKRGIIEKPSFWIGLFLALGYTANLLPWLSVKRCTFMYHYMPSADFALLALAWLLTSLPREKRIRSALIATVSIGSIIACFIYFFPIYYGLPIESKDFYSRMWLTSWI